MLQSWYRLLDYRQELIDVCDQVSIELHSNRIRRENWMIQHNHWKRTRLMHITGFGTEDVPETDPATEPERN